MQKCIESRSDKMWSKSIGSRCIESYPAELKFGNFLRLWRHYKATIELLTTPVFFGRDRIWVLSEVQPEGWRTSRKKARVRGEYIIYIIEITAQAPRLLQRWVGQTTHRPRAPHADRTRTPRRAHACSKDPFEIPSRNALSETAPKAFIAGPNL